MCSTARSTSYVTEPHPIVQVLTLRLVIRHYDLDFIHARVRYVLQYVSPQSEDENGHFESRTYATCNALYGRTHNLPLEPAHGYLYIEPTELRVISSGASTSGGLLMLCSRPLPDNRKYRDAASSSGSMLDAVGGAAG